MAFTTGYLAEHPLPSGITGALGLGGYQLLADIGGVGAGRLGPQAFLLIAPDPETTYYETLTAMTRAQRTDRSRRIRSFDEEFSAFFRGRHHLPPRQDRAAEGPSDTLPTEASFAEPDPALSETQLS